MIVIKNKLVPFGDYDCINLFGILFTKIKLSDENINHENIHTVQLLELIPIGAIIILFIDLFVNMSLWYYLLSICTFYIFYCIEYLLIRLFHKKQKDAYYDVSFEEEAYINDKNLNYLKTRKRYSSFKYIKIKSTK